jgi:hypothetical protein
MISRDIIVSSDSAPVTHYDLLQRFAKLKDMSETDPHLVKSLHHLRLEACSICLRNWLLDTPEHELHD